MSKAADNIRLVIIMAATLLVMSMGALRLMKLQLVDGSSYLQKSLSSNTAEQVINAPRGEIADSSGEYLVSNKAVAPAPAAGLPAHRAYRMPHRSADRTNYRS